MAIRKKDPQKTLLNQEQIDLCREYREYDAVVEFLLDQCNPVVYNPDAKPLQIYPHQEAVFRAFWHYGFIYLCAARRLCKTFCIGEFMACVAGMLSGMEGEFKVGIISGTLRQVGNNFKEIEKAYHRSPLLRSMTLVPPKKSQDKYEWILKGWKDSADTYHPGVQIYGYPLGAQSSSAMIRGEGFKILIIDEFQMVPETSYSAIFPTAATSDDPTEGVRRAAAKKKALQTAKRDKSAKFQPPPFDPRQNRMILAGTATWQFEPAYLKFCAYKTAAKLNRASLKLLNKLGGYYPEDDTYRAEMVNIATMLPKKLRQKYMRIQEPDVKMHSNLVTEFIDYLRERWSWRKYMCFQMSMEVAPEGWYEEDFLESMESIFSPAEIEMEFFARWLADSDGPFPASMLESATNRGLDVMLRRDGHSEFIIGIDPATSRKFGIVVLRLVDRGDMKAVEVVYTREYDVTAEAMGHPAQHKLVFDVLNRFSPVRACVIDQGGGGLSLQQSLSHPTDAYGCWGAFGAPALSFDYEPHTVPRIKGNHVLWVIPMPNKFTTQTNNRIRSAMQAGAFEFSGKYLTRGLDPDEVKTVTEIDRVYDDIRKLKSQMQQLIVKPAGLEVKYDLPGEPGDATHVHDLWSALTLAYAGFLEVTEGEVLGKKKVVLPVGFWGTTWAWAGGIR